MGTTPKFGLPYPEGTDLVISGDDAIQALAEAVETSLAWGDNATFAFADVVQSIPPSGVAVGWAGAATLVGFTYDGAAGAVIYTGPLRPFIISTSVAISNGGSNARSSIEVRVNGVTIMGSAQLATSANFTANHSVSVPAHLQPGDIIDVIAYANPTGDLDGHALRVCPIGPKL